MTDDINKELELLSPLLYQLRQEGQGNLEELPEGYFEQLEMAVRSKCLKEEVTEELSPLLLRLRQDTGLEEEQLPDDYFGQLEGQLKERLQAEPKFRQLSPLALMSIAASFLLLVIAGTWWLKGTKSDSPFAYEQMMRLQFHKAIENLPLAEADAYLLERTDDWDSEDLLAEMGEEQLGGLPSVLDSLPPIISPKTKIEENKNPLPPDKNKVSTNELEEEIIDDSDLEELLKQIKDDELELLKAALLKPKKKE